MRKPIALAVTGNLDVSSEALHNNEKETEKSAKKGLTLESVVAISRIT